MITEKQRAEVEDRRSALRRTGGVVGWVERSETHHFSSQAETYTGFYETVNFG
jgi:hypothetical protein